MVSSATARVRSLVSVVEPSTEWLEIVLMDIVNRAGEDEKKLGQRKSSFEFWLYPTKSA